MTRVAYVCTNCPKGRALYDQLINSPPVSPHIVETGCLGNCQYAPRVIIAARGEETQLGSRKIGEPLNIMPLGKNPRTTIETALAQLQE